MSWSRLLVSPTSPPSVTTQAGRGASPPRPHAPAARDSAAPAPPAATLTPLLPRRGQREGGDIQPYAAGSREAGIENRAPPRVPNAGPFAQEGPPAEVWRLIREFAAQ